MMAASALVDGDGPILFELLAIIEYLDETHPNPPLLPRDARGRARVRGLATITGSAVVTLASCRIQIVRGDREPPRDCRTMAPGAGWLRPA